MSHELLAKSAPASRQALVGVNSKVFPKQASLSPTNNPDNEKPTPELRAVVPGGPVEAPVMPQGEAMFQGGKKKFESVRKIDRVMRAKGVKIRSYPLLVVPVKSPFKLVWDTIVLLLILWIAMFLPWQIVFPDDQIPALDIVILVFFILDIVVNLRTTYYDEENEEIVDSKLIITNYISSPSFAIDLLSAFPISELYSGSNQKIIKILQPNLHYYTTKSNLIKITRLLRLGRIFKLLQNENVKLLSMFLNYLFQFLLLFHWINCLWLTLVFDQTDNNHLTVILIMSFIMKTSNAWIPVNLRFVYSSATQNQLLNLVDSFYNDPQTFSRATQYIFSYYSLIMVILGSDICKETQHNPQLLKEPVTIGQQYYINGVGILGSISLAILFGKISLILQQAYQITYKKQTLEDEVQTILVRNKLPDKTQERALEYFEYCWKRLEGTYTKQIGDLFSINQGEIFQGSLSSYRISACFKFMKN